MASEGSQQKRERSEAALERKADLTTESLAPLLEVLPDALVCVNEEGIITHVNGQAEQLFGYQRSQLCGHPLDLLLPERFRPAHQQHRQRYHSAPRARPMGVGLQLYARHHSGSDFPVDISLAPVLLDGELQVLAAIRDMTSKLRAERLREQHLQHLRLQSELMNLAHDAIVVRDPINRILLWNQGAQQLYGFSEQEALGRLSHVLLTTHFPESRAALETSLSRTGEWEGELTSLRRDGSSILVESRQVLVRDQQGEPLATLEITRDITQRRRQERASQTLHEETLARLSFFQHVLDVLPSSISLVYGPDARLLLTNQAAAQLWGARWQPDQPLLEFVRQHGVLILDERGEPLPPQELAALRALHQGTAVFAQQETICQPGGRQVPIIVHAIPLPSSQVVSGDLLQVRSQRAESEPLALVIHQDVTALKEAEALKDEFIGIAAHELRTPLAVLSGYAEMLLRQTARGHGPELALWQQEALVAIKEATTSLVTLTEDLLDVTRLQAGRLHLQRIATNLVPLIRRIVAKLQHTTTRHTLLFEASSPQLVATIDPSRIEQVLSNLIGNAIKYSPRGGEIQLVLQEEPGAQSLCLSVQDSGIGIPRHQHAQIFGRFVRAENAQIEGISGTGLGLYLSRELVERHGGQLWFESEEGEGSTFFLRLPRLSSEQNQEAPTPTEL